MVEAPASASYPLRMAEWFVEFEGKQKLLDDVWSPEMAKIVGPMRDQVTAALNSAADPDELAGLEVVVYAEDGAWGFKLAGPQDAVNYAIALIGMERPIYPSAN